MAAFDDNNGSALRGQAPNPELASRDLPKLIVSHGHEGVPGLRISNSPQYRYTKEETGQHPLTDRADAILPPKFKGDHTFDPTTRVFEPTLAKTDDRVAFAEHQQNVNPTFRSQDTTRESAPLLQMPERSLFSGGSSGGDSSLKGPDLGVQKSLSTLFEPSRPQGNSDGSLFVIIIASLAVLLSSILKFFAQIFWPWVNRMNFRKRRVKFHRR